MFYDGLSSGLRENVQWITSARLAGFDALRNTMSHVTNYVSFVTL